MKWKMFVIPIILVVIGIILLSFNNEVLQNIGIGEIFLGCALALINFLLYKWRENAGNISNIKKSRNQNQYSKYLKD